MITKPADYRKEIAPYRVCFNWEITHKCNYKCSYCDFSRPDSQKPETPTFAPGLAALMDAWRAIYARYGSCEIHFAGGEPFVYPNFMDFIEQLSDIHTMEFSTNLFWDPDEFIRRIRPGRARIGVSFHTEYVDLDTFFSKAAKLKRAGFEVWVNCVAYPPYMGKLEESKARFESAGMSVSTLPFRGEWEGKRYPESYTEPQREFLRKLGTTVNIEKTMEFAFDRERRVIRRKLCRMGQMYAKIHPNGDAYNCCKKDALKLGNIFDSTFSLLENPHVCEFDNCPCWRGMLLENESYWKEHWPVPPDAR